MGAYTPIVRFDATFGAAPITRLGVAIVAVFNAFDESVTADSFAAWRTHGLTGEADLDGTGVRAAISQELVPIIAGFESF